MLLLLDATRCQTMNTSLALSPIEFWRLCSMEAGMLGAGIVRPLLDVSRCSRPMARGIAASASAHGMATATIG